MSTHRDPRVDGYIAKSAAFAQPILTHLRALIHAACPAAEEDMKWSFPHFMYRRKILCSIAAFKAHCAFGFWHHGMGKLLTADDVKDEPAMGDFGRITSLAELPPEKKLTGYLQRAVALHDSGALGRPRPAVKKRKFELPVPADLAAALKKNKRAAANFANFSPSHRKEYIAWITEAKRNETRQKRLATTIEWLAEGKPRNWKYVRC
jgi:uncharacterized protein YdeI (YjbR/CyaY-like superfamily)